MGQLGCFLQPLQEKENSALISCSTRRVTSRARTLDVLSELCQSRVFLIHHSHVEKVAWAEMASGAEGLKDICWL